MGVVAAKEGLIVLNIDQTIPNGIAEPVVGGGEVVDEQGSQIRGVEDRFSASLGYAHIRSGIFNGAVVISMIFLSSES